METTMRTVQFLRRPYLLDCGVALAFVGLAVWVGHGLWPDPATRELTGNPADQVLIEWFLAADTRLLLFEHGLLTDRLNAPDGMNMLANATSPTLGFLLAPVTLTLGAPVSFAVLTAGSLAATAIAWYLLFSRTLGAHRAVAAAGGALCGFAPGMVSHSNSHWHMAAQWLVPAIVWSVVRLTRAAEAKHRRRAVTSGLWLAGLVVAQYFLGAEVLYLTAVTLLLVSLAYAALRPSWIRQILPGFAIGMAVAVGAAALLLAYPLWMQFAGPGSVPNLPFTIEYFVADLASWPAYSSLTLAGRNNPPGNLTTSVAEYNTFLGWPLLVVAAAGVVWLWRRPLALAAAFAALVMGVLALGPERVVNGERLGIALPYEALLGQPVVEGALPQRYALPVVPLIAAVLVMALERARHLDGPTGLIAPAAVTLALLPLFPTPLPTGDRAPVPAFISEGHWRECVDEGGVLVPVPLPTAAQPEPMRWAAAANAEFAIPEGFFIGPYGVDGGATVGTWKTGTSNLLDGVAQTGTVPPIGPGERTQATQDIAFWDADCVVLGPGQPYEAQLHQTLEQLLGPGERVADAWIWRV